LWKTSFAAIEDIEYEACTYGIKLINELDIPIAETPLGAQQSKFFKTVYQYTRQPLAEQLIIDKE
jgi:hypothetical protein